MDTNQQRGNNCKNKGKIYMNSRQYEKMRNEQLAETLKKEGITEYKSVRLSCDQQEYEVTMNNSEIITIPSGLPFHED
jgi:hypothetical protein